MRQNGVFLPAFLIAFGSGSFIFALWLSAYLDPSIRWLHFFQAWMYLATIGLSAALFWDYTNLFVTTFFISGLRWLGSWISTAQLRRLDQIVAVPAWIGNFLVIAGCVWGYTQLRQKGLTDIARFLVAFVFTTAFFAISIAVCQPRYLPLFSAILHPHYPWW